MQNSPKQNRVQADWDKNSAQDLIHTGLQDAVKRNCNCVRQVRKGVSEAEEDFNRRCLAALQAWMVLPGEPQRIFDEMLLKPRCGAVDANSVYLGNPPHAECDFEKASLPHI